jgi:hypothetical protein
MLLGDLAIGQWGTIFATHPMEIGGARLEVHDVVVTATAMSGDGHGAAPLVGLTSSHGIDRSKRGRSLNSLICLYPGIHL